jgi:hypothetical protein
MFLTVCESKVTALFIKELMRSWSQRNTAPVLLSHEVCVLLVYIQV